MSVMRSIDQKVERIVAHSREISAENLKLGQQNLKLKSDNEALKGKIAELERRVNVLELRDGLSGGGSDTKRAQARVNRLMREVDQCIALLNR